MPFKTDKQRRYLFAMKPSVARQIAYKQEGGYSSTVSQGGRDFTVTTDGQVIDDQGAVITNTPAGRNVLARAKSGYTAEQAAATDKRIEGNVDGFRAMVEGGPTVLASFIPGVGEYLDMVELHDELRQNPINWGMVALLGGSLLVGFVPGIGDAAAAAMRTAVRPLIRGAEKIGVVDRTIRSQTIAANRAQSTGLPVPVPCQMATGGKVGECMVTPEGDVVKRGPVAGTETIYYLDNGVVKSRTGTREELAKEMGLSSANSLKKAQGGTKGNKWNKTGEFTDDQIHASAKAARDKEFVDPSTVEAVKGTRMSWKNFSGAERDEIEDSVDRVLADEIGKLGRQDIDDYGVIWGNPEPYQLVSDFYTDYKATAALEKEIAESAWPKIVEALEPWKEKGASDYNKLVAWAKNRSTKVFSKSHEGVTRNYGAEHRLSGAGLSGARKLDRLVRKQGNEWLKDIDLKGVDDKRKLKIAESGLIDTITGLGAHPIRSEGGYNQLITLKKQLGAALGKSNLGIDKLYTFDEAGKLVGVPHGVGLISGFDKSGAVKFPQSEATRYELGHKLEKQFLAEVEKRMRPVTTSEQLPQLMDWLTAPTLRGTSSTPFTHAPVIKGQGKQIDSPDPTTVDLFGHHKGTRGYE